MKKNARRHLTDFRPDQLPWYQHAVKTFGKRTFGISLKSMRGHPASHSLWTTRKHREDGGKGLEDFWAQHDKSKKAVGYKYCWE